MSDRDPSDRQDLGAVPSIVDQDVWDAALAELRIREKAATRELDAIAAARRRLPMVELPEYTLEGADGANVPFVPILTLPFTLTVAPEKVVVPVEVKVLL